MKKIPHVYLPYFWVVLMVAVILPSWTHAQPTSVNEVMRELVTLGKQKEYGKIVQMGRAQQQVISQEGSATQQITFYQITGNAYLSMGIPDSALWALNQGVELAESKGLQQALPQLWNLRGKTHFFLGDLASAFADTRKGLSLGNKLEQWGEVSNAFIALGNFHYQERHLDSAIHYYRKEAALASQRGKSTTTTLMNIGIVWDTRGQVDSALHYYLLALEQSEADSNHHQKVKVLHNIGTFYDDRGDHAAALTYYRQTLTLFDQLEDEQNKLILEYNIANVLLNQNKTDLAIEALRDVSAKARKLNRPEIEGYCHLSLARAYMDRDNEMQTRSSLDSLDQLLERSPDKFLETELLLLESQHHQKHGDLENAIEYAWKAQKQAVETDQASTLIAAHILLARNYILSNRKTLAASHAQTALNLANSKGFLEDASTASNLLAQHHRETGNYERAYYYLDLAQTYRDSLSQEMAQAEMNRLMLHRLEREYRELQNAQEVREAQLEANEAQLDKQQWKFFTALSVAGVFAIFLISLYYNRRRLKGINKRLNEQNRQIERQNAKLSQLNQDKDRLMHAVAHDLRNPINGIKGLTEVMKDEASGTLKQGMEHIHRSSAHALDIISELVSQETDEAAHLVTSDVDINQLVQDVMRNHQQHANRKKIVLHYDSKGQVMAKTDGDKVQRVIDNLVSNAIKFSPSEKEVVVSLQDINGRFQIEVKDQGPGLTDDDRKKLFGKFQKLSAKPTSGEPSTGLGLSIVEDFTKALGGKIEVQSTPGNGATFIVTLPKRPPGSSNGTM